MHTRQEGRQHVGASNSSNDTARGVHAHLHRQHKRLVVVGGHKSGGNIGSDGQQQAWHSPLQQCVKEQPETAGVYRTKSVVRLTSVVVMIPMIAPSATM